MVQPGIVSGLFYRSWGPHGAYKIVVYKVGQVKRGQLYTLSDFLIFCIVLIVNKRRVQLLYKTRSYCSAEIARVAFTNKCMQHY